MEHKAQQHKIQHIDCKHDPQPQFLVKVFETKVKNAVKEYQAYHKPCMNRQEVVPIAVDKSGQCFPCGFEAVQLQVPYEDYEKIGQQQFPNPFPKEALQIFLSFPLKRVGQPVAREDEESSYY